MKNKKIYGMYKFFCLWITELGTASEHARSILSRTIISMQTVFKIFQITKQDEKIDLSNQTSKGLTQ